MTCNVGKIDRIIRAVLGAAAIAWGVMDQNWLGAIGIIPLATGVIGWCPLYTLFGINTGCQIKND